MHLHIYDRKVRREIYTKLAGATFDLDAPVCVVFFQSDLTDFCIGGREVIGRAKWRGEYYEIGLRHTLAPSDELATLAHELAHVKLGHVPKVANDEAHTRGDLIAAERIRGEGTHEQIKTYRQIEQAADTLAAQILDAWRAQGIAW